MKASALLCFLAAAFATGCTDTSPTEFSNGLIKCKFGRAQPIAVGSVLEDSSGGATFCVEAEQGGTYALVPFLSGARDTVARVTVSVFGAGLAAAPTGLDFVRPRAALNAEPDLVTLRNATDALHYALREREQQTLPAHVPLVGYSTTSRAAATVLAPGDTLRLNVSTDCTRLDRRVARVAATSNHAIVAYDPNNPVKEAYTEDDWRTFARLFDELIYPTLLPSFGQETDIDHNGHVILFFTRAVNEVVPPGSVGIAGGFFWRGDLYPHTATTRIPACAGSNEAEVLYLAVPDPDGEVRGVPVSYKTLRDVIVGTIGHEFQHLINSGRRLYVTNAPVLEETWLNEGLSYIAEELLFYAAAGLTPGMNLDVQTVISSKQRLDAFNAYGVNNLGRLNVFLQAPQDWSLMGKDGIPTRGAAWSFLRYVADRDPRPDAELWHALIDGQSASLDNLKAALGRDPLPWMQDWSVALFADDFVPGLDARFQEPSWNLRDLIAALRIDQRYPLRVLPLAGRDGFSIRLQPGSAAYPVFTLAPHTRALVGLEAEGETSDRILRTALIRVQ